MPSGSQLPLSSRTLWVASSTALNHEGALKTAAGWPEACLFQNELL